MKHLTIKKSIIFCCAFMGFFLVDWLTKYYLFNHPEKDYGLIGFRSFPHYNTTVFAFLGVKIPIWSRHLINFSILFLFLVAYIFLIKKKTLFTTISLAILFSGIMGNSLDVLFTNGNYVRDIIFIPWLDYGTFNFADIFAVIGAMLFATSIIMSQI